MCVTGIEWWRIGFMFFKNRWGRGQPDDIGAINLGDEKFDPDSDKKPRAGQILWIRGLTRLQTQVTIPISHSHVITRSQRSLGLPSPRPRDEVKQYQVNMRKKNNNIELTRLLEIAAHATLRLLSLIGLGPTSLPRRPGVDFLGLVSSSNRLCSTFFVESRVFCHRLYYNAQYIPYHRSDKLFSFLTMTVCADWPLHCEWLFTGRESGWRNDKRNTEISLDFACYWFPAAFLVDENTVSYFLNYFIGRNEAIQTLQFV